MFVFIYSRKWDTVQEIKIKKKFQEKCKTAMAVEIIMEKIKTGSVFVETDNSHPCLHKDTHTHTNTP